MLGFGNDENIFACEGGKGGGFVKKKTYFIILLQVGFSVMGKGGRGYHNRKTTPYVRFCACVQVFV